MFSRYFKIKKSIFEKIKSAATLDTSDIKDRGLKLSEESGEVNRAILAYKKVHGNGHRNLGREDVLEELVDTVISAVSVMYTMDKGDDFTQKEIDDMFEKKIAKYIGKVS